MRKTISNLNILQKFALILEGKHIKWYLIISNNGPKIRLIKWA